MRMIMMSMTLKKMMSSAKTMKKRNRSNIQVQRYHLTASSNLWNIDGQSGEDLLIREFSLNAIEGQKVPEIQREI